MPGYSLLFSGQVFLAHFSANYYPRKRYGPFAQPFRPHLVEAPETFSRRKKVGSEK
jgi:hypothetical protein